MSKSLFDTLSFQAGLKRSGLASGCAHAKGAHWPDCSAKTKAHVPGFCRLDFIFPPVGGKTLRGPLTGSCVQRSGRAFMNSMKSLPLIAAGSVCRQTMKKTFASEQRGMCAGGKKPPARSIKRFFELLEVRKTAPSGAKRLFRPAGAGACPRRLGLPAHGVNCGDGTGCWKLTAGASPRPTIEKGGEAWTNR